MPDRPGPPGAATVLLTPEGTVTGWSEGAERLFGHDARTAAGAPLPDLLGRPDAAEPLLVALKLAGSGRSWSGMLPLTAEGLPAALDPMTGGDGRVQVLLTVSPPWTGGLDLLNEAGRRIGSTLDLHLTAREIVAVTVPRFADAGAIYVLERLLADDDQPATEADGSAVVRRLAIAFAEDDPRGWAREFPVNEVIVYPPTTPYARCLATGAMVEFGGDAIQDTLAHRTGRIIDGLLDHVSLLAVPLLARGRSLGFAVFSRKRGRPPFSAADAVLAAELAARAATCVDNACLYRREHRTATALKAGLLPSRVTAPPGLEIAHRYLPARSGVGGDWYDVVPLTGDRIAVVIGDSVGHGVTAAAAMGQLRVAAHTLASCEFPPGEVLERLDAIAQDLDAAQFATCLCLVCDPVTLRCEVARAGHPPPLLAMPDGSARHFAVPNGLPLGVSDPEHPPAYGQVPAVLPPGATLALYTDGLVESRMRNVDEGIARLASALVASDDGTLEETADGVLALLADQQGHDDIALLLIRAVPDQAPAPGHAPGL
ncbi:serine/threonine-protein phosphatase [Actinomadura madurae]|uniref:PP2C family protein-serine/threonine phosphatase n=2 Tax=Actinomadura madurae TaxID=1993 RepID=UPI002025D97D|nr:PP2C family protein-serine/threonine phosphatase [Actinomadura madurae]MCP9947782.1 serine/threonine-protein phosphatase [Actinomadura madurae]MCP9964547.1 serine/threonine-protein phosphatase [Actinomadura madurae]URN04170.1 serine/threonine-protein phosphatase [Actinomadura madurae]